MSGFDKGFATGFLSALGGTYAALGAFALGRLLWRRGRKARPPSDVPDDAKPPDADTEAAWRQIQNYDARTAYGE